MSAASTLLELRRTPAQCTLAGATAVSAAALGFEVYLEHYKGSYADKWMWTPIALTPPLVAACAAAIASPRAARTWMPLFGALYALDGMVGVVTHVRGVMRKPGGLHEPLYNLVMGPPLLAPGAFVAVGALAIVAAMLRRER